MSRRPRSATRRTVVAGAIGRPGAARRGVTSKSGIKIALALTAILASSALRPAIVRDAAAGWVTSRDAQAGMPRTRVRDRLALSLQEARADLRSSWAAKVADFDARHRHLLVKADLHASGMMKPLPALRE